MAKLPKVYREEGAEPSGFWVPDVSLADGKKGLVLGYNDVVIINQMRRTFYLALRKAEPMAEELWIMGGLRKMGHDLPASIRRKFKEETGLEIPEERFRYVGRFEFVWKGGYGHPIDDVFYVELSLDELTQIVLEPNEYKEYNVTYGLQEYDYQDLIAVKPHQFLLDLYEEIFGEG